MKTKEKYARCFVILLDYTIFAKSPYDFGSHWAEHLHDVIRLYNESIGEDWYKAKRCC